MDDLLAPGIQRLRANIKDNNNNSQEEGVGVGGEGAQQNKRKLIKVAAPTLWGLYELIPSTSCARSERTWRAGGLFCTCSVGDGDAG